MKIEATLLTGGIDKPYAFGLALALASKDVTVDVIGSDEIDSPDLHTTPRIRFLNLRGDQRHDAGLFTKVSRVFSYYARLLRYASTTHSGIFHILWNNKFQTFDRTLLMLYYRLLGKKIVLTAHNINAGKRDSNDSAMNRLTLKIQYRLADHIFVHTGKMKTELVRDFGVSTQRITVIPLGFNNSVPNTHLTAAEAKHALGIGTSDETILFFGRIGPYKGLEHLVDAFRQLATRSPRYRLIIAGAPKLGSEKYFEEIQLAIQRDASRDRVIQNIEFIPDERTEIYFKAADVSILPYTQSYQSGVLVLGYSFGLPVIAADIGSFREDIVEGRTGFLCKPSDSADLAETIDAYFHSPLFEDLNERRQEIQDYARTRHSWEVAAEVTRNAYAQLIDRSWPEHFGRSCMTDATGHEKAPKHRH